MNRDLVIEMVERLVKSKFSRIKSIRAIYLYGSILTNAFFRSSDIDLLFIVDDISNRSLFLKKIKALRAAVKEFNLDISVVFHSEFIRLWHIFRPPTFFIWIKRNNMLLCGEDLLRNVQESAITAQSVYKRSVDLAQGSRSVYLNDKNVLFWEKKYVKWLRELEYGVLYLCGEIETDHKLCEEKICGALPELKKVKLLQKRHLPIKTISEIAESFAHCVHKNFIKNQ